MSGNMNTHAEQASLASGVAEHLLHGALLQGEGVPAGELVPVGELHRAAARGLEQHVGEQEEHLGLGDRTFPRNHLQPALTDEPPPCERGGNGKSLRHCGLCPLA